MIDRFVKIKAIKNNYTNEFVPIWECKFEENENYGDGYSYKGISYQKVVDVYWDTKHKNIVLGKLQVDVYPDKSNYKLGKILVEQNHHILDLDEIVDISFEEYESVVIKYFTDDYKYYEKYIEQKDKSQLEIGDLIEFKIWKPCYHTKNNGIIKWDYKLYNLKENENGTC